MSRVQRAIELLREELAVTRELPDSEQLAIAQAVTEDVQTLVDQLLAGYHTTSLSARKLDLIELNKVLVKATQILSRPALATYKEDEE